MRRTEIWKTTLMVTSVIVLALSACGGGEGRPLVLEEVFAGVAEDASVDGGPTDGATRDGG